MNKTVNHKAWFFVLPVVVLVAFNAIIPLMTVVNFSVQETFGDNAFFWSGTTWFQQVLHPKRRHRRSLTAKTIFHALYARGASNPSSFAIRRPCRRRGLFALFKHGLRVRHRP